MGQRLDIAYKRIAKLEKNTVGSIVLLETNKHLLALELHIDSIDERIVAHEKQIAALLKKVKKINKGIDALKGLLEDGD